MTMESLPGWFAAADAAGSSSGSPLAEAASVEAEAAPLDLHLVFPAHGEEGEGARVRCALKSDILIVNFEVATRDLNPEKMGDAVIYNGNVVELFICVTAKPALTPRPYYEFEVSRYDQELQVLIDQEGKFHEKWKAAGFKHSVAVRPERPGWNAAMEIPLKELGWNGERATLVGNAFAILGAKGARRFYSAFLPRQPKPNFHLPNFFKPLLISKIA